MRRHFGQIGGNVGNRAVVRRYFNQPAIAGGVVGAKHKFFIRCRPNNRRCRIFHDVPVRVENRPVCGNFIAGRIIGNVIPFRRGNRNFAAAGLVDQLAGIVIDDHVRGGNAHLVPAIVGVIRREIARHVLAVLVECAGSFRRNFGGEIFGVIGARIKARRLRSRAANPPSLRVRVVGGNAVDGNRFAFIVKRLSGFCGDDELPAAGNFHGGLDRSLQLRKALPRDLKRAVAVNRSRERRCGEKFALVVNVGTRRGVIPRDAFAGIVVRHGKRSRERNCARAGNLFHRLLRTRRDGKRGAGSDGDAARVVKQRIAGKREFAARHEHRSRERSIERDAVPVCGNGSDDRLSVAVERDGRRSVRGDFECAVPGEIYGAVFREGKFCERKRGARGDGRRELIACFERARKRERSRRNDQVRLRGKCARARNFQRVRARFFN